MRRLRFEHVDVVFGAPTECGVAGDQKQSLLSSLVLERAHGGMVTEKVHLFLAFSFTLKDLITDLRGGLRMPPMR